MQRNSIRRTSTTLPSLHNTRRSAAEQLEARHLLAGLPQLVADLNLDTDGSAPIGFVQVGPFAFFVADDGIHGRELWKTDGTAANTVLVKDINPGPANSFPQEFTEHNGQVVFVADDGVNGQALWTSDGTAVGTEMVIDVNPGFFGANIRELFSTGGMLLFSANDGTNGQELWISDGVPGGTTTLVDINPEPVDINPTRGHSYPRSFVESGGTVFFFADDGVTGRELWKTGGTPQTTELVKDINVGPDNSISVGGPGVDVNGAFFFAADDGINGQELWVSDGTELGTQLVADIAPSGNSLPRNLHAFGNELLFGISLNSDHEIWKVDATTLIAEFVSDLDTFEFATELNGEVFFKARDTGNDVELWKTDGTAGGTTRVKDIFPGPGSSDPRDLTNFNGKLYFTANDATFSANQQLWTSDGTEAGTVPVVDINPNDEDAIGGLTVLNGQLLFRAEDGLTSSELWKSDGTIGNAVLVKNINTETSNGMASLDSYYEGVPSLYGGQPVELNGKLIFVATDGDRRRLFASNGTLNGTTPIADLQQDIDNQSIHSFPSELTVVGSDVFFIALDPVHGDELWKTDGVVAERITDIRPGDVGSDVTGLTNADGTLFFLADDGVTGRRVWIHDGTNTVPVPFDPVDVANGTTPSQNTISQIVAVADAVFFNASDSAHGRELWKSDGTVVTRVVDINAGPKDSDPTGLTNINGTLFFAANDSPNFPGNKELWKHDGTTTSMVADIWPGFSSEPRHLTNINGTLFFEADDGVTGRELWKSNGEEAGTVLVKDINASANGSFPREFVEFNGLTFFTARTDAEGRELWQTDGTAGGTVLVKDIRPGSTGSFFSDYYYGGYDIQGELTVSNGVLYFGASDGTTGTELFRSDGTTAGTTLVTDLLPGVDGDIFTFPPLPAGSHPAGLIDVNGTLFFTARDETRGFELWKVDSTSSPTINIPPGEATIQVFEENGELVVAGSVEFFRGALGSMPGVVINGAADSETFEVDIDNLSSAVLPDGITINAGEGVSDDDTLVVNGSQTVTNYEYTTGGPESGTIELDGLEIIFSQFEPIIDNLPVTNRRFTIGTSGGHTIRIADDGVANNGLSTIDDNGTGAFESLTFSSPSNTFEIAAGDGSDTITVSQLDDAFGAVLTVDAEGGDDSVDATGYNLPITIQGGAGSDNLQGGAGNDNIDGGDGDDTISGGTGNDQLDGGAGNNNVTVDAEDDISLAEGDVLNLVLTVTGAADGDIAIVDWADGSLPENVVVSGGEISASHTYTEDSTALPGGVYAATVTVNSVVTDIDVTVNNAPPQLVISGPASVGDGETYNLALSATDPGNDTITTWTITWGDGDVEVIAGNPAIVQHVFPPGVASYTISATATDEDGTFDSNSITVLAGDAAPIASISGPTGGVRGQVRTFTLSATDTPTDEGAGFTFNVDYGDGTSEMVAASPGNGAGTTVTHTYAEAGSFVVTVTATDQGNQTSEPASQSIDVAVAQLQEDPLNAGQSALFVGGSTGRDKITLRKGSQADTVRVKLKEKDNDILHDLQFGPDVSRIVVFGQDGNDQIKAATSLGSIPTEQHGDAGNDTLTAGFGDDLLFGGEGNDTLFGLLGQNVLVGGDGDDVLFGGLGRNVMIGGRGADDLIGGLTEDLLIAGSSLHDHDIVALAAVRDEWTSTRDYDARVANLRGTGSGPDFDARLNGDTFLQAGGPNATVIDDQDRDVVFGSFGRDWYFAKLTGGTSTDLVLGRQSNEELDEHE